MNQEQFADLLHNIKYGGLPCVRGIEFTSEQIEQVRQACTERIEEATSYPLTFKENLDAE